MTEKNIGEKIDIESKEIITKICEPGFLSKVETLFATFKDRYSSNITMATIQVKKRNVHIKTPEKSFYLQKSRVLKGLKFINPSIAKPHTRTIISLETLKANNIKQIIGKSNDKNIYINCFDSQFTVQIENENHIVVENGKTFFIRNFVVTGTAVNDKKYE